MHGDAKMQKITPCLWFNDQAEEAARFYTSIFKNSTIGEITHYGEGSPRPKGSVLTVRFQLDGQEFLALNGGPQFKFTEAVSFIVHCETQEELDRMWEKLSEGGEEVQCGWLKDQYGLSWQIVPTVLPKMLSDPDSARAERVLQAVMRMKKLDINTLEEAFGPR
jgi:predicted 3-demethylubiquinone-9 3-methyltransferase (glyoxalase superfamily)